MKLPPGWTATGKSLGTVDLLGARRTRQVVADAEETERVLDIVKIDGEYLKAISLNASKTKGLTSSPYLGNVLECGFLEESTYYQISDLSLAPSSRTSESPISEKRLGSIFADLFYGLNHLHEHKLIHAAFSPLSIWWHQPLQINELWWMHAFRGIPLNPVLQDFFPREIPDLTLDYCAPELLMEDHIGFEIDVYSLGATLYYLATGEPPRGRGVGADRRQLVGTSPVVPLATYRSDLSKEMSALITAMLLPRPEKRASMSALKDIADFYAQVNPTRH